MKSIAWSLLVQQRQVLGPRFLQRHGHDWLVWEPGAWNVPRGNTSVSVTAVPKKQSQSAPAKGDPLCFVLAEPISIGRAEGNSLVLSDETVSRQHCLLERRDGNWWVQRQPGSGVLKVDGTELQGPAPLSNGQHLALGEVVLTFMSAWGMVKRLEGG